MKFGNLLCLAFSMLLVLLTALPAPAQSVEQAPSALPVAPSPGGRGRGGRAVPNSNALESQGIVIKRVKPDTAYYITLESDTINLYGPSYGGGNGSTQRLMILRNTTDKESLPAIIRKAVEWHDKAQEIKAEPFTKEIPGLSYKGSPARFVWKVYTFDTQTTYEGILAIPNSLDRPPTYETLNMRDARVFADLTKEIPAMEKEYDERVERAKKQDELFK